MCSAIKHPIIDLKYNTNYKNLNPVYNILVIIYRILLRN
ncbi:hypothetical protein ND00_24880 [Clostridium sp. L74]|nr:hypothetical protein ND00_24880 [Clostridium sp. L74]